MPGGRSVAYPRGLAAPISSSNSSTSPNRTARPDLHTRRATRKLVRPDPCAAGRSCHQSTGEKNHDDHLTWRLSCMVGLLIGNQARHAAWTTRDGPVRSYVNEAQIPRTKRAMPRRTRANGSTMPFRQKGSRIHHRHPRASSRLSRQRAARSQPLDTCEGYPHAVHSSTCHVNAARRLLKP